jgi:hypothetical protein
MASLSGLIPVSGIKRTQKTGSYTFTNADLGGLFDWTSGTPCSGTTPASGISAGWFVYARNSTTGVLTVTAGQGTIDALASIKVYPSESFVVEFDGTNFHTVGRARGLIYLNTTTLSTSVSTVSFSLGFDDPEISEMRFDYYLSVNAAATGAQSRVEISKSASYKTSYTNIHLIGTPTSPSSNGAGTLALSGLTNTVGDIALGVVNVTNQRSAVANSQLIQIMGFYKTTASRTDFNNGVESTAAAIDGLRFNTGDTGDTWNSGNVVVYGMRN